MLGTASTARASRKRNWLTTNTSIEPAHCANFFHCPPLAPTARSEGSLVGVSATGASQSRAAHRKAQVPSGYSVLAVGVIVSIKSKIVCAVPSGSAPRNLTLCGRRRATGKGKGCVLSSAKIILFFESPRFSTRKHSYFSISRREKQKHGDFFRSAPCFSHRSPSFSGLPPALERNR